MEPIALDVHAHLAPVEPAALAPIDGVTWEALREALIVDGHAVGLKPLFRPQELIGWMDEQAVARAWISAPPPLYRQHLRGGPAAAWAGYLNNGLAAIAARYPARLDPLMHLPIDCTATAVAVARHWIGQDVARFSAPAGGDPQTLVSDAAYEPLWQALDEARAFVFFHPGECADGRLRSFYLANLLGNPYETTVTLAHLAFGGVLEAFPNITFCFAHGGGAAPALAGRFARGFATDRPGINKGREAPAKALARVCVDCIVHDPAALALVGTVFGEDNVVFGSDWPFPMGLPKPHAQLADVDAAMRRRLFCDNPERMVARLKQGVSS